MTERLNPSDVAGVPTDDEPMAAEQSAPSSDATSSTTSRSLGPLLTTETPGDVSPDSVQREYGVSKGFALILFGIIQMSGQDGMPAVGNMLLGLFLELRGRDLGGDDSGADHDDSDDGAGGIETV